MSLIKIVDGELIDLNDYYSDEILDRDFGTDWWSDNINLVIDFDFEKQFDIVEMLHETVRKYLPKDEIQYCEDVWDPEYMEDMGIILNGNQWCPRKLREIQDFLDKINHIVEPIKSECNVRIIEGTWYILEEPFAIASLVQTDEGIKILGTDLDQAGADE